MPPEFLPHLTLPRLDTADQLLSKGSHLCPKEMQLCWGTPAQHHCLQSRGGKAYFGQSFPLTLQIHCPEPTAHPSLNKLAPGLSLLTSFLSSFSQTLAEESLTSLHLPPLGGPGLEPQPCPRKGWAPTGSCRLGLASR